jgi:serine/threonine-protein kinase
MDPDRLKALERIFEEAVARDGADRQAFLDAACPEASMRAEIEALLRSHDEAAGYFDALGAEVARRGLLEVEAASREQIRIDNYRTLQVIGHGGMGTVFLAERADGQYDHRVALKLIRLGIDSDAAVRRFLAERQIVARLDHPNIARLLDGGVTGEGRPYFVMEYVAGRPITDHCDESRLSIEARLRLFLALGGAVQYAHGHLVVHRDLKPGNVLVTADGQVKLLDFGIAKLLEGDREAGDVSLLTRTRERVLTPAHAAPEQILGEAVTTAVDVYAMGVLLYELLTGRRPHEPAGLTETEFERRVVEAEPIRPSQVPLTQSVAAARATRPERLGRMLTGDLDTICLTALRRDPARRYRSVEHLVEDVRRYLAGMPIAAREDTLAYRAGKFVGRHRVGVAMAAALFLIVTAFAGIVTVQSLRLADERDKARQVAALLVDLFEVADPSEARGESITAREVLDRGVERIRGQLAGQPEVQAELLEVVGRVYRNLGLYQQAMPLVAGALDARRRSFGPEHPDVAALAADLGELQRLSGDYRAAESTLRNVVALDRSREPSPRAARTLNHLGKVLVATGRLDEAEEVARHAMQMATATLGALHEEVAESLNTIAAVRFTKGDDAAAEPLFRQALDIRRQRLGQDHPLVPAVLNNLASLLSRRGDHPAAESAYREALDIYRRLFGSEHPRIATTINNLGLTFLARQRPEEAEPLFRESLAMRRRLLPATHPDIAQSASNLGLLLQTTGRLRDAEPLYREALDVRRQALGVVHPLYAQSLNNLALLRQAQGDLQEAQRLFEQALAILTKALGPRHLLVATSHHNLGALFRARRETDLAERHFREALAIRAALLPAGHPDRVLTQSSLDALRADAR